MINKRLSKLESTEEGIVALPFGFTVNGTSDPATSSLRGSSMVSTITRASAGKFLVTLKKKPAHGFGGYATARISGDSTDLIGVIDDSTIVSAGTFYVKFKTGSTNTDPADTTIVRGVVFIKKTTRARAGFSS